MLSSSQAKILLKNEIGLIPVILGCQTHFEIAIEGQSITPKRIGKTPQARRFKTLSAAYSYLRTYVEYRGDVSFVCLNTLKQTRLNKYELSRSADRIFFHGVVGLYPTNHWHVPKSAIRIADDEFHKKTIVGR